jgi:lipoyl(octanoyl) transferase
MRFHDLGLLEYRAAWKLQEEAHAAVLAGGEEQLFFVEHPPVITLGRRPGLSKHILASSADLTRRGIEVIESDRGGDITFHGPGQLVAYPIVRLVDHQLSVSGYVHWLERIVIQTLNDFGIEAFVDPKAVGVWTRSPGCTSGAPTKIAAIGVRIRRGVTLHGLSLNVTTDLSFFNLIIPCGLENRQVTSMVQLLPDPLSMVQVKEKLKQRIIESFNH